MKKKYASLTEGRLGFQGTEEHEQNPSRNTATLWKLRGNWGTS